MMIVRLLTLFVLAVLPSSVFAADFFRIGSFNIEHCGSRSPGQQPIAIAEHIDLSGAVALALQEINVTDTIADDPATPYDESRRNSILDTAFGILNQNGEREWKYEIFQNRGVNDKTQLCALAWDAKKIKRDSAAMPIGVGPTNNKLWDRRPHAVKLAYGDKTDIVIIPVHMKANSWRNNNKNIETRRKEAEALVSQLPNISTNFNGEEDIIICGDCNSKSASEPSVGIYKAAGYRDTNSLDVATYVGGKGAPFDRFFLSPSKEFVFARQYILQPAESVAHDTYLSDHAMILLSFRVKADDD